MTAVDALIWVFATCLAIVLVLFAAWVCFHMIMNALDRFNGDERLASDVVRRVYELERLSVKLFDGHEAHRQWHRDRVAREPIAAPEAPAKTRMDCGCES
jgi:hypothetical protein